jgi:hypothetical protein
MSTRDWLARELEEELRTDSELAQPEERWFDAALAAAVNESDMSDRSIDLLVEIGDAGLSGQVTLPGVLVADPSIAARREALGISLDDAAHQVGVSRDGYEGIERTPLRWLNVQDTGKVTAYLARLGVGRAVFLRWLASLQPSATGQAWGYRPGATVDRPVDVPRADQDHFLSWGQQLLHEAASMQGPAKAEHLLGHDWSQPTANDRAATILAAAQARLLSGDLRVDRPESPTDASVIAFKTERGTVYPAFQFDREGRLPTIVAEVNALLGATNDPWGVADWWLSPDASIGGRPVDLIAGSPADLNRLRQAARDLLEAD